MIGTSAAVQATSRRSAYRPHRVAGRKAEYGRFSVLPRPEIHRNLRIKDSVKIDPVTGSGWFFGLYMIGKLDAIDDLLGQYKLLTSNAAAGTTVYGSKLFPYLR